MRIVWIVLVFISSTAYAGNNCYLHERGSESWSACMEQATQNEKWWDNHRADQRQLQATTDQAISNDSQRDRLAILLLAIEAKRKHQNDVNNH